MNSNKFMQTQRQKTAGQSLVEFSLILPLLLFITLGIIDFGRLLVIYSGVSSAMRDAARNAEILGYTSGGVPTYRSCDTILADATNVILQDIDSSQIRVLYYEANDLFNKKSASELSDILDNLEAFKNPAADPSPNETDYFDYADYDCDADGTVPIIGTTDLETGDIMVVVAEINVEFITPIMSSIWSDGLDFNIRAQRTVVTKLKLEDNPWDRDSDGLLDDWEFYEFGCLWEVPAAYSAYEDSGFIVRPTGLVVDPTTHEAFVDPLNSPYHLYVADAKTYAGEAPNSANDPQYSDAALKSMASWRIKETYTGSGVYEGWAFSACQFEQRLLTYYTDANDQGEFYPFGDEYPYWSSYDEIGCYEDPDDSNYLLCPVPAWEEFNATNDPDGDACNNGCEEAKSTEPIEGLAGSSSTDTDDDGLLDGEEVNNVDYPTDPTKWDSDGDGLSDGQEVLIYFSNPNNPDSDGDGLTDFEEANYKDPITDELLATSNADGEFTTDDDGNPIIDTSLWGINDPDTDNDGINDYDELIAGYSSPPQVVNGTTKTFSGTTNPMKADTDGDGIDDKTEIDGFFIGAVYIYLDPNNSDTDGDGISDGDEKAIYDANPDVNAATFSSPYTDDTDGDGLKDGKEVPIADGGYGTYPNDSNSDDEFEGCAGPDGTGTYYLDDEVESIGPFVESAGNNIDPDGDDIANGLDDNSDDLSGGSEILSDGVTELTDCVEVHQYSTNPYKWDTDGDGVSDLDEINCSVLSPLIKDSNGDGVDDTQADADSCDNTDSDGDSLGDIWEGEFGFGCVYTVGSADLLNPDGLAFSVSGGIATYVGTATYPDDCDGYGAGTDEYYLGFGAGDDPDQDGCDNTCELNRHTDPLDPDTDNDGLKDGDEITTSPLLADTDGDTLLDGEEVNTYGSDPLDKDSDNDGLADGDEVAVGTALSDVDCDVDGDGTNYPTDTNDEVLNANPAICDSLDGIVDSDTDGDGILDGLEVYTYLTSPILYDTDGDGLSDFEELFIYGTDPKLADTDGDTLTDGDEVDFYLTDANEADTDGDGLTDGEEVAGFDMTIVLSSGGTVTSTTVVSIPGYDPDNPPIELDPATYTLDPTNSDSDFDGWADGYEVYLQGEVDGLGNPVKNGTNPIDPDTDGDDTPDGIDGEPLDGTDIGDSDGDGLIDDDEINIWLTDPNDTDTDDDGLGDAFETSVAIDVEYYTSSYSSGDPDGSYLENVVLEGYSFDTDSDGIADSVELYLYEIITGGSVPADVQTVIDGILADADANNDTMVQCLYYTDPDPDLTPDPANGLHPGVSDTDGDGVGDGDECNVYLTDPLNGVLENDVIVDKIPNESFRDLVYAALEHQYDLIAIIVIGDLDSEGRYPVSIIRKGDGGGGYIDITSAITGACGTTSTFDGSNFTEHTDVCGILDTNYDNNATDQTWYAWIAPSAIYSFIQDDGVIVVNAN